MMRVQSNLEAEDAISALWRRIVARIAELEEQPDHLDAT